MITFLIVSQILLWAVLAALVLAGVAVARQVGVLHERVAPVGALVPRHGPVVGSPAPKLAMTSLQGQTVVLGGQLPEGTSRLLLFVSAQCPICKKLIPIAKGFARTEKIDVVFAGDDDAETQRKLVADMDIAAFPFLNSTELGRAYGVDKLPHAVLLDAQGRIVARGLVNSREHLESLVVAREMGVASVQDYLKSKAANAA